MPIYGDSPEAYRKPQSIIMMKYQSSAFISNNQSRPQHSVFKKVRSTQKKRKENAKCELTNASGAITYESCNSIEFIFVAHWKLLHTLVGPFRPAYENSCILPRPIQTEWFQKWFDHCNKQGHLFPTSSSNVRGESTPLTIALRLESRRANSGRMLSFTSSLIPPLMILPENREKPARRHFNRLKV